MNVTASSGQTGVSLVMCFGAGIGCDAWERLSRYYASYADCNRLSPCGFRRMDWRPWVGVGWCGDGSGGGFDLRGEMDLEAKGGYVTRRGHVGGLEGDE
ncbi:hypothetical protein Tco_0608331 [Tanacetum coccineum]